MTKAFKNFVANTVFAFYDPSKNSNKDRSKWTIPVPDEVKKEKFQKLVAALEKTSDQQERNRLIDETFGGTMLQEMASVEPKARTREENNKSSLIESWLRSFTSETDVFDVIGLHYRAYHQGYKYTNLTDELTSKIDLFDKTAVNTPNKPYLIDSLKALKDHMSKQYDKNKSFTTREIKTIRETFKMLDIISDKTVKRDDKIEAIAQYEKTLQPKTWPHVVGAIIVAIIATAVFTVIGAAIGMAGGLAAGAWTGPGAMGTAFLGLVTGSITGWAAGIAAASTTFGATVGGAVLAAGLTLKNISLDNRVKNVSKSATNFFSKMTILEMAGIEDTASQDNTVKPLV